MAIMINCKAYALSIDKENVLWKSIKDNLPDNVICYCNCEVEGIIVSFCLLIEDIGLFVVESRDWNAANITGVTLSGEVELAYGNDEIITEVSPRRSAKMCQLAIKDVLNENFNANPPVYSIVCYPYISRKEYNEKKMNQLSESELTLFKEDISDLISFAEKLMSIHSDFSYIKTDIMDERMYKVCRNYFEGRSSGDLTGNPYSILNIYSSAPSLAEIKKIIEMYLKGIKIIIFVKEFESVELIAFQLAEQLNLANLQISGENLVFSKDPGNDIDIKENHFNIFNFEVFGSDSFDFSDNYSIINGRTDDSEKEVLKKIRERVSFNLEQYNIEHAEVNHDIYVKAGAGTGKTYSMVSRIAYLTINNLVSGITKVDEEIVMLTFTKKAAANMKIRLKNMYMNYFTLTKNPRFLELIANAEKMQISTIHSFTRNIIQKTSIPFGIGTEFKTVSGIYERRNIFNRNFDAYLKKKNSEDPYYVYNLPVNVSILQNKFLKLSELLYNKGIDIKSVSIDSFGEPSGVLPDINELIEEVIIKTEKEYSQWLIENNSVRLSEYMIYLNNSIKAKSFNSSFYSFKYLFIDEFQDTDDAQIEAFLAMQEKIGFNLFIVGDLKQSIYRFRGSTMDAFSKMGCDSESWLNYTLSINYRTDKNVLSIYDIRFSEWGSKEVYEGKCMLPFTQGEDNLTGIKENSNYEKKVEHIVVNESDFEEELLKKLNDEIVKLTAISENTDLSEAGRTIAILVRTNKQAQEITSLAKKNDILIESDTVGDLYKIQPSVDLCKLTSALCNPYNIAYLFDLINSNYIKAKYNSLQNIKEKSDEEKLEILTSFLDNFFKERLDRTWLQLISEIQTRPVLMMLRIIYENLQPWMNYSVDENVRQYYRSNYDLVFEELSDDDNDNYLSLESINESLHINIETGTEKKSKGLNIEKSGVKVVCQTVHKAKGLEYGTVIMPFMDCPFGKIGANTVTVSVEDDKIGYIITYPGVCIHNSFFNETTEINESIMEETRILYVAMTRAINNFIYYTSSDVKADTWEDIIGDLP